MFVAIPTAIPIVPLTRMLGNLLGKTLGSSLLPSKLGSKSTVFLFISFSNSVAILEILASVYLYAAAPSPSIEQKLPCPSINVCLSLKSCAILTKAS